jgi:hypothetical protein
MRLGWTTVHFIAGHIFMKKICFLALVVALTSSSAQAGVVLTSRLAAAQAHPDGPDLFAEDQSREVLVDVDNNGRITDGDVIFGFLRIDETSPPSASTGNSLYAIFSQTFNGNPTPTGGVDGSGPYARYEGSFRATTQAGYRVEDLLGALDPGFVDPTAMFAVVEKVGGFSTNLITANQSNGFFVMTDYLNVLRSEGTLDIIGGLSEPGDFFAYETPKFRLGDPVGNIAVIPTVGESFTVATFDAGLSVVQSFMGPAVTFNDVTGTPWELVVSSGTSFGAKNLNNGNFNTNDPNFPLGTDGGFGDKANFALNATVAPEPASVVVWTLLACGTCGVIRFRRRK